MKTIPVTKPFLPPLKEYYHYLQQIWKNEWLTNMGPMANELENQLKEHLGVRHLHFVTNGTVALQMAIKALNLKGEIITTPFSFVATTSSIVWEGCKPVFADIHPKTLNIDPEKIEEKITKHTSAILATHVYGNPCDVEDIETLAKKYGLKVIYDGAHAFGVNVNGKSVFEFGDISICSLHATKLYHSGEGGFIVTKDEALFKKLKYIRNFGISGFDSFSELGINGKNSEFHAAMGLTNLKYKSEIHAKRESISEAYDEQLKDLPHFRPQWHPQANQNYAYYPIVLESEQILLKIKSKLAEHNIQTRRYFYPSLAKALPYLPHTEMPVTEDIAKRVLCLPLYFDLTLKEVKMICKLIDKQ